MGSPNNRGIGGINVSKCLRSLVRRKQVDSEGASSSSSGHNQLAKALSIPHLIAIGVGSTIGAGVYILIGTVAREDTGPALTLSFLIAGIAAALSAFCYAELASRCPCAGSAYHYSYICVGECVAWLIGWALILEYTLGGSAVARGISPNLALLLGGKTSLPFFLARHYIPDLDMTVDPCAAILVFIITVLLCFGIKESMLVNSIVTSANVGAMIFIIVVGGYLGYTSGWTGYGLPSGFFPYGVDGMLAGSATVFFAYVGFDSVASAAEEVKNPKKDLPLGIALSLAICCTLYMLVSVVIVGLVPYYHLNPDTPISSAFGSHGMQWAAYVVTAGTITALCSSLVGSILPQPRILMAMARDGLLPPFFSDINKRYQVPIKSTVATGIAAAALAFFMEVSQLAGMVSVGTLLAFTMVAISVLIVRYVPPNEVPVSSSLQGSVDEISSRHSHAIANSTTDEDGSKPSPLSKKGTIKPMSAPLILKQVAEGNLMFSDQERRIVAGWTIVVTCIGVVILTSAASIPQLPSILRYVLCGLGGAILLCGLIILTSLDQDDARHSFGHSGGFICPMVPLLPIICILINVYLLINLGGGTWKRVSMWLAVGVLIYVFYGRSHSTLRDTVYVPKAHVDEIYKSSHDTFS